MDRELPQEESVDVLDRPDPWGDIPGVDGFDSPDPVGLTASATGETRRTPTTDDPPKKERSQSRRAKRSEQAATEPRVDSAPEVPADPALDDPWVKLNGPRPADHVGTEPTDADLAPPPARPEPEPVEVAQLEPAEPEPEPATVAADSDHTARIPPWPDQSLDVLPSADRSSWPGVRKRGDGEVAVPALTPDGPPEPATNPGEADLETYALSAPRAAGLTSPPPAC